MHIYLKIKEKELSAEAKFNKHEQRKVLKKARFARGQGKTISERYRMKQYFGMKDHLDNVVKRHIRCTHIARGMLAGVDYKDIERWTYKPLSAMDWDYVREMVMTYGEENPKYNQSLAERWNEWFNHAEGWVASFQDADEGTRAKIIRKWCPLKPKRKVRYCKENGALIYSA